MTKKHKLTTTHERSKLMSSVRQKGTSAELRVRRIVESFGYDYKTNLNNLPGSPDLVNKEDSWAIFVHGCFWHAHERCRRWTIPKRNRQFWIEKFEKNRERDKRKVEKLKSKGYSVLVVWECETDTDIRNRIEEFFTRRTLA